MAKTYTSVPNVNTGDVYTASAFNTYTAQNINNLRVPPAARITRTTTQSINNATWTHIDFAAGSDYDTDGMYAAADKTKLTIQTAGMYLVTAQVTFGINSTGVRLAQIEKNPVSAGSAVGLAFANGNALSGVITDNAFCITFTGTLAVNDVLKVAVYHNSGGALNLVANPNQSLTATWLGQVS